MALISFTAKLICVFVFTYAKGRFFLTPRLIYFHDEVQTVYMYRALLCGLEKYIHYQFCHMADIFDLHIFSHLVLHNILAHSVVFNVVCSS